VQARLAWDGMPASGYYGLGPGNKVADKLTPLETALRKFPLENGIEILNFLEKIARNIVSSPSEEKFRKVKISNPKFSAAEDALKELGFQREGELLVLTGRLDFQQHVVKIIEAKDFYQKQAEKAKKADRLANDPGKAAMLQQLELDRRERAAGVAAKANKPQEGSVQSLAVTPAGDAGSAPAHASHASSEQVVHGVEADTSGGPTAAAVLAESDPPGTSLPDTSGDLELARKMQEEEDARARAGRAGDALPDQQSMPVPVAPDVFHVGDEAEVEILDGLWAGQWFRVRVKGQGSRPGTYNVYILPTDKFDRVGGHAGTEAQDIAVEHMRRPKADRGDACGLQDCVLS